MTKKRGRPKGSTRKPPSEVRRVPVPILPEVDRIIKEFKESLK